MTRRTSPTITVVQDTIRNQTLILVRRLASRRREGQLEAHLGARGARAAGDVSREDPSAVRLDDALDDGQAQAVARAVRRACARGIATHEGLERPLGEAVGKARSSIANDDTSPAAAVSFARD